MTASQYKVNRETLAFRLAIHAAFGNTLVIVGMSLNDDYLRQQIEASRASLEEIYWFDSQFPGRLATWAQQHEIKMAKIDWSTFGTAGVSYRSISNRQICALHGIWRSVKRVTKCPAGRWPIFNGRYPVGPMRILPGLGGWSNLWQSRVSGSANPEDLD